MQGELAKFGLQLESFFIQNVSLPPEVEKTLDQRAGMAAVGTSMDQFTQFQVANAIPKAASAGGDGGLAGAGLGAGIGMAMGNAMAGALNPGATQTQNAPPTASGIMVRCTQCNQVNPETAKFCSECGNKLFAD